MRTELDLLQLLSFQIHIPRCARVTSVRGRILLCTSCIFLFVAQSLYLSFISPLLAPGSLICSSLPSCYFCLSCDFLLFALCSLLPRSIPALTTRRTVSWHRSITGSMNINLPSLLGFLCLWTHLFLTDPVESDWSHSRQQWCFRMRGKYFFLSVNVKWNSVESFWSSVWWIVSHYSLTFFFPVVE